MLFGSNPGHFISSVFRQPTSSHHESSTCRHFASNIVPTSLKQAVLSPLLKKPLLDHELYPNFRPVSNLQFISKSIEKVVSVRVLDHIHENGLQECLQSVYKEHHSCETALVCVQNNILHSINDNRCVLLLLLDILEGESGWRSGH